MEEETFKMKQEEYTKLEDEEKRVGKLIERAEAKYLRPHYKKRNKIREQLQTLNCKDKLGKCFVFKNSYSGDPNWPLYIKIIGVKDGHLLAEHVQKTYYGEIEIEVNKTYYHSSFDHSYTEITHEEYEEAKEKILMEAGIK